MDDVLAEPAEAAPEEEKKIPWPKTLEELIAYLKEQTTTAEGEPIPFDYNTSAQAVVNVTVASFNFLASTMGLSGFQASWCTIQIISHIRDMKGPFWIVDGTRMLYPQYDLHAELSKHIKEWRPWAAEEAKKLMEREDHQACGGVVMHWQRLIDYATEQENIPEPT